MESKIDKIIKKENKGFFWNLMKIVIAILGAIEIIFDIFVPIAIILLIILIYDLNNVSRTLLLLAGIFASLFKALVVSGLVDKYIEG
jgi:hypothetical protein